MRYPVRYDALLHAADQFQSDTGVRPTFLMMAMTVYNKLLADAQSDLRFIAEDPAQFKAQDLTFWARSILDVSPQYAIWCDRFGKPIGVLNVEA